MSYHTTLPAKTRHRQVFDVDRPPNETPERIARWESATAVEKIPAVVPYLEKWSNGHYSEVLTSSVETLPIDDTGTPLRHCERRVLSSPPEGDGHVAEASAESLIRHIRKKTIMPTFDDTRTDLELDEHGVPTTPGIRFTAALPNPNYTAEFVTLADGTVLDLKTHETISRDRFDDARLTTSYRLDEIRREMVHAFPTAQSMRRLPVSEQWGILDRIDAYLSSARDFRNLDGSWRAHSDDPVVPDASTAGDNLTWEVTYGDRHRTWKLTPLEMWDTGNMPVWPEGDEPTWSPI